MPDLTAAELKKLGLRVTPQRQAILKILNGNKTHPSAEKIYHELLKTFPSVSFATVYNTLSKLVQANKIMELDTDPVRRRFDPDTTPHHHFYCKTCGTVFDIPNDIFMSSNIQNKAGISGHQIDEIQIGFKGICKNCLKAMKK